MRTFLLGLGVALMPFVASGCGGNCSTYCDYIVECFDCDEDDAAETCEQACEDSYDKLSDGEQETADACLDCLDEELGGECRDLEDFVDALEDCDNDCYDDDAEEFFGEWAEDFELGKDCGGGNVCDAAASICGADPEPGASCSGSSACAAQCIVNAGTCTCDINDPNDVLCNCVLGC